MFRKHKRISDNEQAARSDDMSEFRREFLRIYEMADGGVALAPRMCAGKGEPKLVFDDVDLALTAFTDFQFHMTETRDYSRSFDDMNVFIAPLARKGRVWVSTEAAAKELLVARG